MAEIWLWRDGDDPTTGGPLAKLPLADCVTKLQVSPENYYSDLCRPPRFETSQHPPHGVCGWSWARPISADTSTLLCGLMKTRLWLKGGRRAFIEPLYRQRMPVNYCASKGATDRRRGANIRGWYLKAVKVLDGSHHLFAHWLRPLHADADSGGDRLWHWRVGTTRLARGYGSIRSACRTGLPIASFRRSPRPIDSAGGGKHLCRERDGGSEYRRWPAGL